MRSLVALACLAQVDLAPQLEEGRPVLVALEAVKRPARRSGPESGSIDFSTCALTPSSQRGSLCLCA